MNSSHSVCGRIWAPSAKFPRSLCNVCHDNERFETWKWNEEKKTCVVMSNIFSHTMFNMKAHKLWFDKLFPALPINSPVQWAIVCLLELLFMNSTAKIPNLKFILCLLPPPPLSSSSSSCIDWRFGLFAIGKIKSFPSTRMNFEQCLHSFVITGAGTTILWFKLVEIIRLQSSRMEEERFQLKIKEHKMHKMSRWVCCLVCIHSWYNIDAVHCLFAEL